MMSAAGMFVFAHPRLLLQLDSCRVLDHEHLHSLGSETCKHVGKDWDRVGCAEAAGSACRSLSGHALVSAVGS